MKVYMTHCKYQYPTSKQNDYNKRINAKKEIVLERTRFAHEYFLPRERRLLATPYVYVIKLMFGSATQRIYVEVIVYKPGTQ